MVSNNEKGEVSIDAITRMIQQKEFGKLRRVYKDAEEADIAEVFAQLALEEALVAFRVIERPRRPEVFANFASDQQQEFLEALPERISTVLINDMASDDRTQLLEALPEEVRFKYIGRLNPEERETAKQLLSYPAESIGRLMNPEILMLAKTMTVKETVDAIRWQGADLDEENLSQLFIVDDEGRYCGELSLALLVMTDPQSLRLQDIMSTNRMALNVFADQEDAVDCFRKYDRTVLPVLNDEDKLLGIVSADDVFDVAEEEATEDIYQFGGQATLAESYFETPLLDLWKKRAGWLVVLFLGELLTGSALKAYDEKIAAFGFIIYFLPLIISSGGNSGTQAASLVIRGIAIREMAVTDWFRVFKRELVMGLGLGFVLGGMGFVRALTWNYPFVVGLVVFTTLVLVVILGAVLGSMLPFLFQSLKLDPAVSSSPFIACLVDLFGILIFINVAILAIKNASILVHP